jgi:hypothetical protein
MTVEDFMSLFDDNTYFEVESVTDYASGDRFEITHRGASLLKRIVKNVTVQEDGSVYVTVL